jgi:hypothetical protein
MALFILLRSGNEKSDLLLSRTSIDCSASTADKTNQIRPDQIRHL